MIARELEEFFASFSEGGCPGVQRQGDPTFLSNVNACYSRGLLGADYGSAMSPTRRTKASAPIYWRAAGAKVYHPGAAVLHSHDYGFVDFMRRYFDEYRGLRETDWPHRAVRDARRDRAHPAVGARGCSMAWATRGIGE